MKAPPPSEAVEPAITKPSDVMLMDVRRPPRSRGHLSILSAFSMPIVCLVLTDLLRVLMIFASKGRIKSFCHRGSQG
jgi:hypothetical protein